MARTSKFGKPGLQVNERIIGIAEAVITNNPLDILITYSLGSCLGVSMWDPVAKVGALAHFMLPSSKKATAQQAGKPFAFVDTGLVAMLEDVYARGGEPARLIVKIAGAASPMDAAKRFQIGQRNVTIARKLLWKNGLMIAASDVGGTSPRTMRLYMSSGETTVSTDQERELLQGDLVNG